MVIYYKKVRNNPNMSTEWEESDIGERYERLEKEREILMRELVFMTFRESREPCTYNAIKTKIETYINKELEKPNE